MSLAVSRFSKERRMYRVYDAHEDVIADYKNDILKHAEEDERMNVDICFNSILVQLAQTNKRFLYSRIEKSGKNDGVEEYTYTIN